MKKFALIGRETSHSHSKKIHETILAAHGVDCRYDLLSVREEELADVVSMLKKEYDGFNVTIPYKEKIMPFLDDSSEEVALFQSCNTVKVNNGALFGYNTDGDGFMRSLNGFYSVAGKNVLLLGAGGAAVSVAYCLVKAGANLFLCNRTREKAEKLALKLKINAKICDIEMCFSRKYDIIINTTSVGMGEFAGDTPIAVDKLSDFDAAADIIYRPWKTAFLRQAEERGAKILNGFPMLYYQAALADELWLGLTDLCSERELKSLTKEIAE